MNWNLDGSLCPTCCGNGRHNRRYFAAICRPCENLVTDAAGRRVEVSNADIWSGVRIDFGDTQLPEDTLLFVNGIECQAREAHLGGIVIQPVAAWEESRRLVEERRRAGREARKEG